MVTCKSLMMGRIDDDVSGRREDDTVIESVKPMRLTTTWKAPIPTGFLRSRPDLPSSASRSHQTVLLSARRHPIVSLFDEHLALAQYRLSSACCHFAPAAAIKRSVSGTSFLSASTISFQMRAWVFSPSTPVRIGAGLE